MKKKLSLLFMLVIVLGLFFGCKKAEEVAVAPEETAEEFALAEEAEALAEEAEMLEEEAGEIAEEAETL
ncbi:hypothetical protein ACFL5N_01775 [bacterium]